MLPAEKETLNTHEKALAINLSAEKFGTFAEIGAGQEVVRWFFHVGRASATVAKSISAYDTTVSDDMYGSTSHYVSRQRLTAMLDREYALLLKRLDQSRGEKTTFFVFADTVATYSRKRHAGGHGWLGIRFQTALRSEPSDILIHAQLLETDPTDEQEALGVLGVNLIYGAFFYHAEPARILASLTDGIRRRSVEIDVIKFSGPAFQNVDNRLMNLELVVQGLSDAAMFTSAGEVVQPSEVLSNRPVLIERGSFRPITNVTLEMLDSALTQLVSDPQVETSDVVPMMEMTLSNLTTGQTINHRDFLDRVDTLSALGKTVMISNYTRFDRVTSYLRKYTQNWIAMVMGVPILQEIFDESYYADLEGGILEGLGRLFQGRVKLYVYPTKTSQTAEVITAEAIQVAPALSHLYSYLLENGYIQLIQQFHESQLHVYPGQVLSRIQAGDPSWETMVPPAVAELIKQKKLFGYQ